MFVMPVTLPPGRARVATNFDVSGSPTSTMTIGMIFVALIAARVAADVAATMISTLRCTSSSLRAGSRATSPSENRSSIARFFPSSHPSSRNLRRNTSSEACCHSRDVPPSTPIVTDFPACCASPTTTPASSRIAMTAVKSCDGTAG